MSRLTSDGYWYFSRLEKNPSAPRDRDVALGDVLASRTLLDRGGNGVSPKLGCGHVGVRARRRGGDGSRQRTATAATAVAQAGRDWPPRSPPRPTPGHQLQHPRVASGRRGTTAVRRRVLHDTTGFWRFFSRLDWRDSRHGDRDDRTHDESTAPATAKPGEHRGHRNHGDGIPACTSKAT